MIRTVGFICIVLGAGATGYCMAADVRRKEEQLQQLLMALTYMKGEIEFMLKPLGEVCFEISNRCTCKHLRETFLSVSKSIGNAPGRPAGQQMRRALSGNVYLEYGTKEILFDLFSCLGRQDVYAQVRAIAAAERRVEASLEQLQREKTERKRSYRVLGLCAGLAIAVILI